tara:strand:- start:321 stop:1478 length:1158 start_codon:yes stop_codon:yes gene_type:complete
MKKSRSKAFFINGGAGRVISSIPAFEKYAEDSGDKDFIIVCEGGMDFYRGHSVLQKHAYEVWHKGLFEQHIRDKDVVSPEPYRINEYFNQKCSLAQAFDIEINGLEEPRELPDPTITLNKSETVTGYQALQEIKSQLNKDKSIIVQPFGRSVQQMGEYLIDSTSRSFEVGNIISIIEQLRKKYAVVIMAELQLPIPENNDHPVALPREPDLRMWASMINSADHFLGCDSVGQHIAKALDKTATVVIGSTVPINITYLNDNKFDIIDVGTENGRNYSPIRMSMDDELDRQNDAAMEMNKEQERLVVDSCIKFLGEGGKFQGEFTPTQQQNVCNNPDHNHNIEQVPQPRDKYNFNMDNLLADTSPKDGSRKERRAAERAERKEQKKL